MLGEMGGLFALFGSALPFTSSSSTTGPFPFWLAMISGVHPLTVA